MHEPDDMELLRQYAETESGDAFRALVQRHVNLVYSVAQRQAGDPHAAEEITQAVFIILARKASSLNSKTVLSGWLYQTARLTAANYRRTECRRARREQEAFMQSQLDEPQSDETWQRIAPLLDDALGKLGDRDRHAIVLRFFENKSLGEVGAALGASNDAAKMRVNRALEKLRKFFSQRGVTLTVAVIAGAVSANSVQAAPAGLAATISGTVVKGATVTVSTLTLVKGALKIMAWTKAKTAIAVWAGVLLAAGTVTAILLQQGDAHARGKRMIAGHVATPVDLTGRYTTPVSSFDRITQFPAWKTVPRGFQLFANVPLQIEGMICLWGEGNTKMGLVFPEEILGIEVKQKFETLYVYHGSFFASPDKTPVCRVVFRYEDGSSVTNQMLYGHDAIDWLANSGPTGPNSKLAWVGGSYSPKRKQPLRLCLTAIENPQPALEVTSVDLYSSKSRTAACIMAMTTGRAGLLK